MTNALQALLGAKPVAEITETVFIKRLGIDFTVKALSGDDFDNIRAQATQRVKEGKRMVSKVNEEEVARLIIAKATIDPNFGDAQLLKQFGARDAGDCVQKALLAGEITQLQTAILSASGFIEDEDVIDDAKN